MFEIEEKFNDNLYGMEGNSWQHVQKEEASMQHVEVVAEGEIVAKEEIVIVQEEESIVAQMEVDVLKQDASSMPMEFDSSLSKV